MRNRRWPVLALGSAILVWASVAAAADRWVHIHVDERAADGTRVRIQLPLSVFRAALPHLRSGGLSAGTIRLERGSLDDEDLARAREALDAALQGRSVELGADGDRLRMTRDGDWLQLSGDEPGEHRIRIRVPVELARSLLDQLPDVIDLMALVDSLDRLGDSEIARVDTEDTSVRIWVDGSVAENGKESP